jgi:isovaleryl-CoA dehydrogenase
MRYKAQRGPLPIPTSSRTLGYLFRTTLPHRHTNLAQTLPRKLATSQILKMRVPYAPSTAPNEESKAVYDRIAERRAPRPLIPLDLALLHNPSVADGWNSFIGAIRTKTSISEGLKELAIARVAVLNKAVHEWDIHAALALKAGVSKETMQLVLDTPVTGRGWRRDGDMVGLKEDEEAVILYTDQMTIGVEVEEGVAEKVKKVLGDTQTVELTATVAAYNCVSRFLVALDVGECNGRTMKKVEEL